MLSLLFFLVAIPAHADTIQANPVETLELWTSAATLGSTFGLDLCFITCNGTIYNPPDVIASLAFTDIGRESIFLPASNPIAAQFIGYVTNQECGAAGTPCPLPQAETFVELVPSDNSYGGHFDGYPIAGADVYGLLIQSTGSEVTYSVVGTNLVPEPATWLMLLAGMLALSLLGATHRKFLTYSQGFRTTPH
jgi:hypothetical protein